MHLAQLNITNFRKLQNVKLHFQLGLNILVGANNVGKIAIVDVLQALRAGHDEPYPRLSVEGIHHPKGRDTGRDITFEACVKLFMRPF